MDGFLMIPMGQKGQKGQNRVGRIILVDPVLFLEYFIAVLRFPSRP